MKPEIGLNVIYTLSGGDAQAINKGRADFSDFHARLRTLPDAEAATELGTTGHIGHAGNVVSEGDEYPAVIVRDWGGCANLQVLLDGNDTYWATSRSEGDGPGTWRGHGVAASLEVAARKVTHWPHFKPAGDAPQREVQPSLSEADGPVSVTSVEPGHLAPTPGAEPAEVPSGDVLQAAPSVPDEPADEAPASDPELADPAAPETAAADGEEPAANS
jgi:hypothetical protein